MSEGFELAMHLNVRLSNGVIRGQLKCEHFSNEQSDDRIVPLIHGIDTTYNTLSMTYTLWKCCMVSNAI